MTNITHQRFNHDRSNYQGIAAKIDKLPHFLPAITGLANIASGIYNSSNAHTGNWGTKDLGVTEAIQRVIAPSAYADSGGSNLINGSSNKGSTLGANDMGYLNITGGSPFVPIAQLNGTQSSGSGSNGSGSGGPRPGENGYVNPNTIPGNDDYNRLIDEAYSGTNNYLNQAEQALREDQPRVLQDLENQFGISAKTLEQNRDTTYGTLDTNLAKADQRTQNVLADSRRLYDELRRGYGQRFGGASSAGQAATELGNLEQQRQTGRTQQDYSNYANEISSKRVEVERDYATKTEKLQYDKQAAVNEVNREFQSKLLNIVQSRTQNESAKAQAKMQALQELRNQVQQINLAELQFKQQLQLQYAKNSQLVDSQAQTLASLGLGADQSLSSLLGSNSMQTPESDLTVGNTTSTNPASQLFGNIRKKLDENSFISSLTN